MLLGVVLIVLVVKMGDIIDHAVVTTVTDGVTAKNTNTNSNNKYRRNIFFS